MTTNSINPQEKAPDTRNSDFSEVVSCYTKEEALKEAARCIQCANPTCISGCPVAIDIKKFIFQVTQEDLAGAYQTIREKNDFPSMCGRVCPAEYQCRKACVFTKKGEPFAREKAINIHFLERFVGDWGLTQSQSTTVTKDTKKGSVAVVGSGPAGLCCAGELARQGITVTVFESLHKPGGVLAYGIPPFRLPYKVIEHEINTLKTLGVTIIPNTVVGRTLSLENLSTQGFKAIFLGLGAGIPTMLKIPGENANNVYSANEFLTRVNLMGAYRFPEFHTPVTIGAHTVVIGGGNTAIDAARVAFRLQKQSGMTPNTTILYRRTEKEMPARRLEIHHAKEEGVQFQFLVQPVSFHANQEGAVRSLTVLRCELGEPDSSGRRRPIPIEGSEETIPCDVAITAVGLKANQLLPSITPDLKTDQYGDVIVNPETMETSIPGVFAGGDIVGGEGTVIEAMGMAKKAAAAILAHLTSS